MLDATTVTTISKPLGELLNTQSVRREIAGLSCDALRILLKN